MFHLDTTVLPDGVRIDLFIVDGRFTREPHGDSETLHVGGFAIPGLVDAHAHLALNSPAPEGREDEQIRASGRAHLEAGVLAVREPGSPTRATRDLDGGLPRLQTAGRFLATPGGYFPGLAREVTPDELPSAAADELAWSGAWVKVVGDFFGSTGSMVPSWPTEALAEAARVVHDGGGRITMHCMTIGAIEQALEAGFDCIEHGTSITTDLVEEMGRLRMTWVPTMVILDPLRQMLPSMGVPDSDDVMAGFDRHADMVGRAAERGVRLLAGTDAGMVPHGVVASEIRMLAAAGLSPNDALAAGSWEARRYLGLPLIEEGAPADLVIYPDDPTKDLSVLDHPSLIMLGGAITGP
jgi:imidazolonepropionase-like amidohydrolase